MRNLLFYLSVFLIGGCSDANKTSKPEIGTWDLVADHCDEVYEFLDNNTAIVSSPPERSVDRYTLTKLDDSDFYEWTYKVIEYNEQPSCNGTYETYLGQVTTGYVLFKNNDTEMYIYQAPDEKTFIGGFLRKRGGK